MQKIRIFTLSSILIVFAAFSIAAPQTIHAQSFYKLAADDDSGGANAGSGDSGSDDTIFIVAGVAAAAIIGYMIYKRSNEPEEDTTKSSSSSINRLLQNERNSLVNKVKEVKEHIPVDISFSVKKPSAIIPEHVYSVGLSFRF